MMFKYTFWAIRSKQLFGKFKLLQQVTKELKKKMSYELYSWRKKTRLFSIFVWMDMYFLIYTDILNWVQTAIKLGELQRDQTKLTSFSKAG